MTKVKKIIKITAMVLVALFVLFAFLVAPKMVNKNDMSAFKGAFITHRGHHDIEKGIPENSLPSFQRAVEEGYGIEIDVQLSSDGVAMVFHDADLERMCGVEGKIWEYSCEELQKMKLQGTEHTIPTLQQTLDLIDGAVPVVVEYKMDRVDTAVCERGNEILQQYQGDYCIQCFDPRALLWYKKNAPEVARGLIAREYWNDEKLKGSALHYVLSFMVENVAIRPDFIAYKFDESSNISFQLCRLMGAETVGWTIKSEEDFAVAKDVFDCYIFEGFDIEKAAQQAE